MFLFFFSRCSQPAKVNFREKEKQVLDNILGPGRYDARIRPSGENGTGEYRDSCASLIYSLRPSSPCIVILPTFRGESAEKMVNVGWNDFQRKRGGKRNGVFGERYMLLPRTLGREGSSLVECAEDSTRNATRSAPSLMRCDADDDGRAISILTIGDIYLYM